VDGQIAIRPITRADVSHVEAAYPEPERPESRHAERAALQERGDGISLVAWLGGDPVGWVYVRSPSSAGISEHARSTGAAEIVDLFVLPDARGNGHGAALLAGAEDLARQRGWPVIGLAVTVSNPDNDVARSMYERRGYAHDGSGEFEDGYHYWTEDGEQHWDGEPHRYLIKRLVV
jgi:GNAT superfamily N-acetyltransferase